MTTDLPSGPPTPGQLAAATKRRKYGKDGLSEIAKRARATRRWNRYLDNVRRYVETGLLDSQEIDYKRAIERQLQEARRAVLEGDENCLDVVARAISNNLTSTYDKTGLRNWFREQPEEAREALRVIWAEDAGLSTGDRIRTFTPLIPDRLPSGKQAPSSGTGTRLRWIAALLMARDARQFPPYKVTEFAETYERTGHPAPAPGGDEGAHYEHALGFLDELVRRARESGLERPKDRLEAQSVLFAVAGDRGAAPEPTDDRPCWFVGAAFDRWKDQTDRFLRDGVWENGYDDRYLDHVKSIEPGDRIAIKSTYTKKRGLPFDNRGESTSTMAIKATGVVTENVGDGRNLLVQWTPMEPHREWYFYTHQKLLWKVTPDSGALPWAASALIDFTFNGAEQEYDRFLRHWFPARYGEADPDDHEESKAIRDLDRIDPRENLPPLSEVLQHFDQLKSAGDPLIFSGKTVEALHAGLWTDARRHFAVLTGLSGTGKTRLAREYAKAITGDEHAIATITVQPGWYDPAPLLGHVNPLRPDEFVRPAFLELLLRAADRPAEPHFAILDEMNLSHVEQYLAPLLSAMETGDELDLHGRDEKDISGVPGQLRYPPNLVVIGTVNMDETTVGISDKVLDRAFTLEFWNVEVDQWPGWSKAALGNGEELVRGTLKQLMDSLSPARLHFGWRVIKEVVGFVERAAADGGSLDATAALDRVIYAKVLPKLRGDDSARLREALEHCRKTLEGRGLPDCARKVSEMESDLIETGSVRFWR